jgi:CDP-4-dehydro-6-deoxyglucose reductase
MVLDGPSDRDLVFMATGTGVAPFKSMIDYVFEHGWDEGRHVWLFLGCGWEDDLPYREAFREYDRTREGFHFVPSLTREELLTDWAGETDYIQRVLLSYLDDDALDGVSLPSELAAYRDAEPARDIDARIDPADVELYACGITAMVGTLVAAARAVGVNDEHMEYEGFG